MSVYLKRFIAIVLNERVQEAKDAFRIMSGGLTRCVGAVDGRHLPILAPKEYHRDQEKISFHNFPGRC